MEQVKLGESFDAEKILKPVLSDEKIFGVDLYKAGLADDVIKYFTEMNAGPGAVEAVLKKYTA